MAAMFRSLIFWLVLAFAAGLALALWRSDLAYIVRPAISVMMIAAGLFFMFGRVFEGPAAPDVERAFRRWQRGRGAGLIAFGASQLLPMGWWSVTGVFLAVAIMIGTRLATRHEMAALASPPQG